MGKGMKKSERLREMERLYFQRAYSDIQMAERLGVDRTTVFRDRSELETRIPIVKDENGAYYIDRSRYISNIRVNMTEALSLYLAARRASQQTRYAQIPTASALEKLAVTLRQPMTERLVRAADQILQQRSDPRRAAVFETVAQAWVDGLQMRLDYRALRTNRVRTHRFDPYLLEPSPWNDSVYLVGYSSVAHKVITLKMERIEKAVLAGPFTLPGDFDDAQMLKHAWGIWGSEDEPETVRLRFAPGRATRRLRESIWHPLERIEDTPDGGCIWETEIAEWQEMVPWIRGWGADCEVLYPAALREMMAKETQRLATLYGVSRALEIPYYQRLWAKTDREQSRTHPLVCHLIDVAMVTQLLWRESLTDAFREHIAEAMGLDADACGRLLAFWAGCHDLGKASPGFQRKYAAAERDLAAAGLPFAREFTRTSCYHATITTIVLPEILIGLTGCSPKVAAQIAHALGGHHGSWPTHQLLAAQDNVDRVGSGIWADIRLDLASVLRDLLNPVAVSSLGTSTTESNTVLTLFSGLTAVADWIGSMEDFFPFMEAPLNIEEYALLAEQRAAIALRELNWIGWRPPQASQPFQTLFGFEPNAIQAEAIGLAAKLSEPAMVIVEASTGSGKTELALHLANTWTAALQQRGLYVAMPTTATSNQMFQRVTRFLEARFPGQGVAPLLVHGQARWQVETQPRPLTLVDEKSGSNAAVVDMSWFLTRKRSLLAPFAVGTVDQAFLSVLQTRHFFVRLFALSHKTVIFDEVHAYDTYMSTLFQTLLGWLSAVGASVVILSATLPADTRRKLLAAYRRDEDSPAEAIEYPAITWTTATESGVIPLPAGERRHVDLRFIDVTPQSIAHVLEELLVDGGCAAVICNTVRRAQEVFRYLESARLVEPSNLHLFHARYPLGWRNVIEQGILERFGKDGKRPPKSVVVATQVIEQSLDLDFDVMISDLAPVDLLLQRAGRLHRHRRATRPAALAKPQMFVAVSLDEGEVPVLGDAGYVYEPYVLLRTYFCLEGRSALHTPDDTSALIEAVYGPVDEGAIRTERKEILDGALKRKLKRDSEAEYEAVVRLVPGPDDGRLLKAGTLDLEDENPDIHNALQALTRLAPPSVHLVCLHETAHGLNTEPDGTGVMIDLNEAPDAAQTHALALATVTVQRWEVVHFCRQHGFLPPAWQEHPLLRTYYLTVFNQGVCRLGDTGLVLQLNRILGLEIVKEEA